MTYTPVARGGAPRGGAPRALALALALCAIASVGAFDVEGGGVAGARPQMPRAAVAGAPAAQQEGLVAKVGKWGRAYQGFVAGAAKVSRWINFGTGCWLVLSTPLTVLASGLTLRPAEVVLICYLGFYGVMMAGQNVPLGGMQRIFQTYFRFLYTELGRVGFFTLVLAIAWSCAQVSVITRLLAAFNALLVDLGTHQLADRQLAKDFTSMIAAAYANRIDTEEQQRHALTTLH